jgi:hypothetical protein
MSDQSPPSTDGEPERVRPDRQSAAQRRGQETVILNANNLDEMMAEAKAQPPAAPVEAEPAAAAPSTPAPAAAAAEAPMPAAEPAPSARAPEPAIPSGRSGLMIGMIAAAVVLLIVVIVLVLVTR